MKKCVYLCILFAFTLIFVGGCEKHKSTNMEQNEELKEEQETIEGPIEETPTPKMDMENPISELYSLEFEDHSSIPSTWISYHVPQINCDTDDAKKINNEIKEKYGSDVEEELAWNQQGGSVSCYYIKWELVLSDEYTFALIVSSQYPGGSIFHDVYNFDGMNGKIIENKDVLKKAGLKDDEFIKMTKEKCEARYKEKYEQYIQTVQDDYEKQFYQEQLEYTVSDERIHINMPMFNNEGGGISVIADIGSLAGAGSYEEIVKIK